MSLKYKGQFWPPFVEEIATYLGPVQEGMNLCAWRVRVDTRILHPKYGAEAMVVRSAESHQARIVLAQSFLELDSWEQRRVLVHELGHLLTHSMDIAATDLDDYESDFHPLLEIVIDDYARILGPLFELPRFSHDRTANIADSQLNPTMYEVRPHEQRPASDAMGWSTGTI